MLLDCGEGTCDQIVRFYGRDAANDIFKKLDIIYVSHLHADHHIGNKLNFSIKNNRIKNK